MTQFNFLIFILFITNSAFSQELSITGIVKDSTDIIPGATIVNKRTKLGTIATINGEFTIKAKTNDTLTVNYVGKIEYILKL